VHLPKKDVFIVFIALGLAVKVPAQSNSGILTNAAQVRSLNATQAAQAIPVHLRGVVVDQASPQDEAAILADDTAGIYLRSSANLFHDYHRSDLLDVEGFTDPGEFAPIVKVNKVRKVGTAPMPAPRRVSYQELLTGAPDGQWVEITGVVRRCVKPAPGIWRIYLAANGGIVSVRGTDPGNPQVQEDSEVRVQAVCLYQFNQKRQVLTAVLQVPEGLMVQVEKPAPTDPYAAPLRSADSLLQFSADSVIGHRVHVRGVVTHGQPGSMVWIRDGNSGLRIQTQQTENLQPGDEVEVLGFPGYGSSSPLLQDALFRKTGVTQPPAPIFCNVTNVFKFEDDLIAVEAMISDVQPVLEGTALTLNSSGTTFKALLKSSPGSRNNPEWEPGSKVRVAGICSVDHNNGSPTIGVWRPLSFQILMRSPADLAVISLPPWWTPQHVILLLGGVIGGLMLITGVVMMMARHRLKEQGHQRAMAEAEFAAILAERNRLAREIHDTLAQGLVATSVQLRLARKEINGDVSPLQQHLDSAQQLVRQSLQEARNTIWNMRSQVLENGDLVGALKGILQQMTDGTEVQTQFEVAGNMRRLAPVIENNLLRVGQEAITNATKHARARNIKVKVEFSDTQFQLNVSDDGHGFDPAKRRSSAGGFGLVGMRERVAELQGELTIRSGPGQGSEINLTIPLVSEAPSLKTNN
jgi:signal transduction histidine kinase